MQKRIRPEPKDQARARVARFRARERQAELEWERCADWACVTGAWWPSLLPRELLALQAWYRDHGVKVIAGGIIRPWRVDYRRGGERARWWVDRTGEPWAARLGGRRLGSGGGLSKGDRALTDHLGAHQDGRGAVWNLQAVLFFLSKGWGRHLRKVKLKDGKHCLVPAARAVGPAYVVLVTPELDLLYRGALVWENQRVRWRLPGDWTERYWDGPALRLDELEPSRKYGINRAYLKLPIPGHVVPADSDQFKGPKWWGVHHRPGIDLELDWRDNKNSGVMQLHGTRDRVRITDGTWLRDIAKASRAEYDKSVQFALNRRRRLPTVARELIKLAQSAREGDIRVPAGADRRAIGELIQNGAASVMQSSFPRSPISRSASSGVGPKKSALQWETRVCCMQRKTIGLFKGVGHCIHYARRDRERSIGTTYADQHWDSEGSFGHMPDGAGGGARPQLGCSLELKLYLSFS